METIKKYFLGTKNKLGAYATKSIMLVVDACFALTSFFVALLITNNFDFANAGIFLLGKASIILLFYRIVSYIIFKTYLIIIRYVGIRDVKNIFFAVSSSTIAFYLLYLLFPSILPLENALSILLVDFIVLLLLTTGFRVLLRIASDEIKLKSQKSRINTVIFGAGEMGALLQRVISQSGINNYKLVAFFDDNPTVHLKSLNGISIFNPKKSFAEVVKKKDIKIAIIGIKNLSEERRIAFIDECLKYQIKVLKVPSTDSWLNNQPQIGQLTDINFEDLLNRPPILLDKKAICDSIFDKTVIVTGCAGSIGSEIVRQLLKFSPNKIIGIDQAETPMAKTCRDLNKEIKKGIFIPLIGDIKDEIKMKSIFEKYHPDYVFHAAAYKHVPVMEANPEEAIKSNILGTKIIALLASKYKASKFVMISTDKVVNPSNVMGASKRVAEIFVQSLNFYTSNKTQYITTRFGNVLGSNGSVIPIFKRQIEQRKPVTVTHPEIMRYFMTIPEACQLVLEAGAMGLGGEIFVFDMGKPVKILDLAKKMIRMAGLKPEIDIPIIFSGLRPGEKLYEELLAKSENSIATHHPKIKIARVRTYDHEEIKIPIENLINLATNISPTKVIVQKMKEIVPEFMSQNSIFQELDEKTTPERTY